MFEILFSLQQEGVWHIIEKEEVEKNGSYKVP